MEYEQFHKMSFKEARDKIGASGLKILIKNRGKFYHDFFTYGFWRPDFKEKLSILVDHGLDLNEAVCEQWKEKKAPIFQVLSGSGREKASAINALVECGADINLRGDNGRTPIMMAASAKEWGGGSRDLSKPSITKVLIKLGADLSCKDNENKLVTDLADEKSLPILVKAGAPVDIKSRTVLLTAVWAKDLPLALELLQRGLKKNLSAFDYRYNVAFLETVAQSAPVLFKSGFSLAHENVSSPADKKAEKDFNKLLEALSEGKINEAPAACNEDALPAALVLGEWPPKNYGEKLIVSSNLPYFSLEESSDLYDVKLTLSPSDILKSNKVQIRSDEYLSFSDFNIKRERRDISKSIARLLRDVKKDKYIERYFISTNYDFSFKHIPWASEEDLMLAWNELREYIFDVFKSPYYENSDLLAWIIKALGPKSYSGILEWALQGDRSAARYLTRFETARSAPIMASFLADVRFTKGAKNWFHRFPHAAIFGLLSELADPKSVSRPLVMAALRWLALNGHRDSILTFASRLNPEFLSYVEDALAADRSVDFLPKKVPALPSYFLAKMHPAPVLKISGRPLPEHAIDTLARMMLVSNCYLQTAALADVLAACEDVSLEEFAISVYEVWRKNGAKKAEVGFLYGLSYMGRDRSAALLAKDYRSEPFTVASEAAIDCLGAMGNSIALSGLQAIIKLSKYEKARLRAQEVLDDVADERGLTADELDDLAIPDLGLDPEGAIHLHFGPRQFTGQVTAALSLELVDREGKVLKVLPKPLKSDDQALAKLSVAVWKELKRGVSNAGSYQLKRFEQAMLCRRSWGGATFRQVIIPHPLIGAMVRHLVWATLDEGTGALNPFRVDACGAAVSADGSIVTIADNATVILPHPLLLGDRVENWLQIFADNKLAQPFPQLARKWFAQGPETERLISRRDGVRVPLGSLRGLKEKGWAFGEGGAGMIWSVFKRTDEAYASIDVEPGWSLSGYHHDDFGGDQAVKLEISGDDPITYSELVRDFLSLPVVES